MWKQENENALRFILFSVRSSVGLSGNQTDFLYQRSQHTEVFLCSTSYMEFLSSGRVRLYLQRKEAWNVYKIIKHQISMHTHWSTSYLKNMYLLLQVKWVFLLLGGSIAQSNKNSFPLRCQGGSQSHSHEKLILFHWNLTCENWKWTKWRSADKITNMQLHQEFRLEPLLPKNHSITVSKSCLTLVF